MPPPAKTPAMSSVDKALALLRHFSVHKPEIGLSELARLAGHDKTTVLRCMNALERNGFIEQDVQTRRYRLGLTPINLARIRERSFPLLAVLQPHLERLRDRTQETAHATVLSSGRLITTLICEPDRATRVFMDPSLDLPPHATASGLAILANLPASGRAALITGEPYEQFTPATPTNAAQLEQLLEQTRRNGFGRVAQSYDADVVGTAVAYFGPTGLPAGAVAVAAVASRFDPTLAKLIEEELLSTGRALTHEFGGVLPAPHTSQSSKPESAP